jgi:glutathione S-transferase
MPMRVFGTVTSPYVRRVRIVAHELSMPCELCDTSSAEGQALLREKSTVWKVPIAEIDGQVVLDSHTITELLLTQAGSTQLTPLPIDDVEARNAIAIIDGALDSLINRFYLLREGVPESTPYLQKQLERTGAALAALEARIEGAFVTSKRKLGLPEIAIGTAIGWMRFRKAYPIEQHPKLLACHEALEQRPSFAATRPG